MSSVAYPGTWILPPFDDALGRPEISNEDRSQSLLKHKAALATVPPDPELVIVLKAAGHRGEIHSQLTALQLIGHLLGHNLPFEYLLQDPGQGQQP